MVALLRTSFFPLTDDPRAASLAYDDHRVLFYARLRHSEGRESPSLSQPLIVSRHRSPAARVAAWIAEDIAAGPGDWEQLKAELDSDRLSSRRLFSR